MSRLPAILLLLLASMATVAQEGQPASNPARDKVERWVERFESPDRPEWQKPGVVLRVLGLRPGDRVADLGAGTGYFLPFLSGMVTGAGKVYAVDIDRDMLAYVETRQFPYANVQTILAEPDDPRLPAGELDVVLLVDTWHHIKNRPAYIKRLGAALNSSGRVGIVDFHKKELPVGPPVDHKLDRETVLREFEKSGWSLLAESTALPYQYFLIFGPPREKRQLPDRSTSPTD